LQRPLRLLVAEDNATNRAVIARMLQHPMLSVDFATNGQMGLNLLARQAYDAVLMDCQMPEVDGFEATRQIRSGKLPGVNASVPVIALTAYAMPEDRERCVAAGMTDYLAKPVKYPALQAVMERCGLVLPDRLTAGTSAPMPVEETAACDPQQLAMIERLGPVDGPPLLPALTRILFNETPGRLVELWTHLETRNAPELARIAHLLGGSVANFGAKTLRQLLLEVEKAGSQGDWARADALANELEPEWTRVRRFLEEKVDLESQTA
jgi:CheY-like chemotaxis protein